MARTLTMMACMLALSAPAAMAQSANNGSSGSDTPQYGRQQATAFITEDRSNKKLFIHDEYGNLYDGRGDMITPRAVTLKQWPAK
jgi:hypothetical protein